MGTLALTAALYPKEICAVIKNLIWKVVIRARTPALWTCFQAQFDILSIRYAEAIAFQHVLTKYKI